MSFTKGISRFTPSNPANSDNIGAYLRGFTGAIVTSSTVGLKEALDVTQVELDVSLSTRASEATLLLALTELEDINASTDGLEPLITSTNIKLDAANASLDSLETLVGGTNSALSAANSSLDAIEASVAAIDVSIDVSLSTRASEATLSSVLTSVDGLEALVTSTNSKLDLANASLDAIEASAASLDGKTANNYGVATGAIRTASQVGNAAGVADFNAGNASAQTLRTVIASDQTPIQTLATRGTITDHSFLATTTSQPLMASNSTRKYIFIKNIGTGEVWFDFTASAVADSPSIPLSPGETFIMEGSFVSTEAINIRSTTGSRKVVAKEG